MHLFTNGTLLTVEKFSEIMRYLDELIIDNYHQKLQLIKPCREIAEFCELHPELKKKVTIVLRKPKEILTTRGGDSPNRQILVSYGESRCVLPFKQLIIRPDGKVSLCCNDPLGKNTLGDLTKDTILDVWNNDRFKMVRECLYNGRKNWKHCEYCDVFNLQ
jgi:radical SAM protein with 4Fe4S-binding SPASM domain